MNFACRNSGTKCDVHFDKRREEGNGRRTNEQPNIQPHHRRKWWISSFFLKQETGTLSAASHFLHLHKRTGNIFPFVEKKSEKPKTSNRINRLDSPNHVVWLLFWNLSFVLSAESFQDPNIQFSFEACNRQALVQAIHISCGDYFHNEMSSIDSENWCLLQHFIRYPQYFFFLIIYFLGGDCWDFIQSFQKKEIKVNVLWK